MKVRCWLILGGTEAAQALSPSRAIPDAKMEVLHQTRGAPPNAAMFQPGDWFFWKPPGTPWVFQEQLVLVCADVPLM